MNIKNFKFQISNFPPKADQPRADKFRCRYATTAFYFILIFLVANYIAKNSFAQSTPSSSGTATPSTPNAADQQQIQDKQQQIQDLEQKAESYRQMIELNQNKAQTLGNQIKLMESQISSLENDVNDYPAKNRRYRTRYRIIVRPNRIRSKKIFRRKKLSWVSCFRPIMKMTRIR